MLNYSSVNFFKAFLFKYYRVLTIIIFPIIISFSILVFIKKPEIDFINDSNYAIGKFTDVNELGNSFCDVKKNKNNFEVDFVLHNRLDFPFAGVIIQKKQKPYFDISNYNLVLTIETQQDFRLSIRLNQFLENYSDTTKEMSFLMLIKSIGLTKGTNEFTIKTKDINDVPDWWFKMNPKKINDIKKHFFNKTQNLLLSSDQSNIIGESISYRVSAFKLKYDYSIWLIWSLISATIYYLVLIIFWKFKNEKVKYILLPIEAIQFHEASRNINIDLVLYIGTNYSNSELRLKDVSKYFGISEEEVSNILKQYCNKRFKQYLNHIRMEEAKRLLKESKLQISEIAYKVGYSTVTHFNRVFKEYTNNSPSNYREQ